MIRWKRRWWLPSVARGQIAVRLITTLTMLFLSTAASAACVMSPSVAANLGTFSPAAVQAGAVPALRTRAGLTCDGALLVLLGGNYIRATFNSARGLRLGRSGDIDGLPYKVSADPNGAVPISQGGSVDYLQNNLLNLLGLLGGSSADMPFYVRPTNAAGLPPGVYTDRITVRWSWNLCPGGISLLGLCLGYHDAGSGTSIIDVSMNVTLRDVTLRITSATTWDPIIGTRSPKAISGGRQRIAVAVANPDIVPIDRSTIHIVLPTPTNMTVALDGDGASTQAITNVDGFPVAGVTLRYGGASDATDDVEFSRDDGQSWAYAPATAEDGRSITHVRLNPKGVMAPGSSFTVSLPYIIR